MFKNVRAIELRVIEGIASEVVSFKDSSSVTHEDARE